MTAEPGADPAAFQRNVLQALRQAHARIEALERAGSEPLAVIGTACRFPGGADTPEAYWRLLRSGTDAITEVPADRWPVEELYDPDPAAAGRTTMRTGGFLEDVDGFDPELFGISAGEAASMDPQQRLVLEVSWEAIERAGLAPDGLGGSQTGVFIGASTFDYALRAFQPGGAPPTAGLHRITGTVNNVVAGRVSYTLGLRGPSLVVDTACSSALVAVHLACRSLRSGECDLALAGGVSLMLSPHLSILFSKAHLLAADGRCKTFDAAADGFGRGEGCGVVVLRRLSDALAGGDPVLAVIRGTAVNQNGRSSSLTAPNGQAQQALIRTALKDARTDPAEVGYVETHGTGTELGDPIEVQALAAVLGEGRAADGPVALGSAKTNIGHLEAASGIASLLKTVLMLQYREVPPNLNLDTPNPYLPWEELPVTVPTRLAPWRAGTGRRVAGVSSFGFNGTNAHVIVAEATDGGDGGWGGQDRVRQPADRAEPDAAERPLHLLCLSTRSQAALRELAGGYRDYLADPSCAPLADVAHTAGRGRAHLSHRAALLADSPERLRGRLAALAVAPAPGDDPEGVRSGEVPPGTPKGGPAIAFLFTGQFAGHAQYPGAGHELRGTLPVLREALEECDELLRPHLDRPLLSILYPGPGRPARVDTTAHAQAALVAVEYALAQVWRSWGIVPSAVLGHGAGEYAAACVAGVLDLADGLRLAAEGGRLIDELAWSGAMAIVFAPEDRVAEAVAPHAGGLAIAAVNGPAHTVISGAAAAVAGVGDALRERGVRVELLPVSRALHSPLVDPALDALERLAAPIEFAAPQVEFVTGLTGEPLPPGSALDGRYLRRHAREAVRFQDGIRALHRLGHTTFLEIGPAPTLVGLGRDCLPEQPVRWLPSLGGAPDEWRSMLGSLGELYVHGAAIDWTGFDRGFHRRHVIAPTYPFQRRSLQG